METALFGLGDIVSLKSHPYLVDTTDIIVSGDHIMIPPLMLVVELIKTRQTILGSSAISETVKYRCIWFSPNAYRFKEALVLEIDIKLIARSIAKISGNTLKRGNKVILKSAPYELAKKKSSLTFDDSVINSDSTKITALLSYLCPVLQVLDIIPYSGKAQTIDKSGSIIRVVPAWEVKCLFFDSQAEKVSETLLPIEALELINDLDDSILKMINETISKSLYLFIYAGGRKTIVKPRSIAYRIGRYYLRSYDLCLNKTVEFDLTNDYSASLIEKPFKNNVPKFDIEKKPESATPQYISQEICDAIESAGNAKNYIRIKYKNRNEEVSRRTIKNYKIIGLKEDETNVYYLVGYCLLRKAERNFRITRIQNLQELDLSFG